MSVLDHAHGDRNESRWRWQRWSRGRDADALEPVLPVREGTHGKAFAHAELGDREPASSLALDALTPKGVQREIGWSRHGPVPEKGCSSASQATTPRNDGYLGRLRSEDEINQLVQDLLRGPVEVGVLLDGVRSAIERVDSEDGIHH